MNIKSAPIYSITKNQIALGGDDKIKDSAMRSFVLGKKGEVYNLDIPSAEDYKGRWDLSK